MATLFWPSQGDDANNLPLPQDSVVKSGPGCGCVVVMIVIDGDVDETEGDSVVHQFSGRGP